MSLANPVVLIRCDASPALGHGHLVRCLALADAFTAIGGLIPVFAVLNDAAAVGVVKAAGYACHTPATVAASDGEAEGAWLAGLVHETAAVALVCDVRTSLAASALAEIRAGGVCVAVIDDPAPRRLAADLAFYPPVPEVDRLSWQGFTGKRLVGWDWLILRAGFSASRSVGEPLRGRRIRILVTMGGSDPAGLTLKALAGLEALAPGVEVAVVLGGGFRHEAELAEQLAQSRLAPALHRSVADMPGLMRRMDLAVASFGMTAYELAALGVPAVHLCLTRGHAEAARAVVEAGQATSLGLHDTVTPDMITAAVRAWRERMDGGRFSLPRIIDGAGALRVAQRLRDSVVYPHPAHVSA